MTASKKDIERMILLAQEGKQISRIVAEDFPKLDYGQVWGEIMYGNQQSSQGIKKMITFRLNWMKSANKADRTLYIDEIRKLVNLLYNNHKINQGKLNKIRTALNA